MNVFITGSSGFVGQNLVPSLSDHNVTTIGRKQLSVISSADIKGADVIIHLAGKAHDLKNTSSSDEYYSVNFSLTKNLYDAFLESSAKKFIFISTVKAVADTVEGLLDENFEANPITHYGKSKLMAEEYILSKVLPDTKSCYILRPCMIHGPGNKGNLTLLYKFVEMRIPYPMAAFDNKRSFLSISNLNMVISALIENCVKSGIYNIADDEALSTNCVIKIIAEVLGFKPRLWKINPRLISMIAKTGDYLGLPLNSERLDKMTESYQVSNTKIKRAIKIDRFPITTTEGLVKTINSIKGK